MAAGGRRSMNSNSRGRVQYSWGPNLAFRQVASAGRHSSWSCDVGLMYLVMDHVGS